MLHLGGVRIVYLVYEDSRDSYSQRDSESDREQYCRGYLLIHGGTLLQQG